jgi:hypothetical protein
MAVFLVPYSSREELCDNINGLGTNKNLVMGPNGARNQEWLCRRGPAAIYWPCKWKGDESCTDHVVADDKFGTVCKEALVAYYNIFHNMLGGNRNFRDS